MIRILAPVALLALAACADRVHRNERPASWFVIRRERLNEQ